MGLNGYLNGDGEQITIANDIHVKVLIGDNVDKSYDLDGTRVPLKITLNKIEDNTLTPIIDKTYDTKGQNGERGSRHITVKHLNKGKYILKVENLKAFKELKGRPTEFIIQSTYRK